VARGHITRQGSPALRWALIEAVLLLTWLKQLADMRLSSSARPRYSDCHAGQLPAHHRRGRASYPLAGRHRLT